MDSGLASLGQPTKSPEHTLKTFFQTNFETFYYVCSCKKVTRTGESFEGGQSVSQENFKKEVLSWIQAGQIRRSVLFFCKCFRATYHSYMQVIHLFNLNDESDFYLTKYCWEDSSLLYDIQQHASEADLRPFHSLLQKLGSEFNSHFQSYPFNYHIQRKQKVRFSCYILMLAVCPQYVSKALHQNMVGLFRDVCSMDIFPHKVATSILRFCSVMLERQKNLHLTITFSSLPQSMNLKEFRLIVECLTSIEMCPNALLETLFRKLESFHLKNVHSLSPFLTQRNRMIRLFMHFHNCSPSLFQEACLQCKCVLQGLYYRQKWTALRDMVVVFADILTTQPMPLKPCEETEKLFKRVYKLQYAVDMVSEKFSECYLSRLIQREDPQSPTNRKLVPKVLKKLLFYSLSYPSVNGLDMFKHYIGKVLQYGFKRCGLIFLEPGLITNISKLLPDLRAFILSETVAAHQNLKERVERIKKKSQSEHCGEIYNSASILRSYEELISSVVESPVQAYCPLFQWVWKYTAYITRHFSCPSHTQRSELISACEHLSLNFLHNYQDPNFFTDPQNVTSVVAYCMSIKLRKLETIEKDPSISWEIHVKLINELFQFEDFLTAAFLHECPAIRAYVLVYILKAFRIKQYSYDARRFFIKDHLYDGYTHKCIDFLPSNRGAYFLNTVFESLWLKEALGSLAPHMNYFRDRVFFTNAVGVKDGMALLFGEYILLSSRLLQRPGTSQNSTFLMLLVAHLLVHLVRRHVTSPSCSALLKCAKAEEIPSHKYQERERKEPDYTVAGEFFGSLIERLSSKTRESIFTAKNWGLNLEELKKIIEIARMQEGKMRSVNDWWSFSHVVDFS